MISPASVISFPTAASSIDFPATIASVMPVSFGTSAGIGRPGSSRKLTASPTVRIRPLSFSYSNGIPQNSMIRSLAVSSPVVSTSITTALAVGLLLPPGFEVLRTSGTNRRSTR